MRPYLDMTEVHDAVDRIVEGRPHAKWSEDTARACVVAASGCTSWGEMERMLEADGLADTHHKQIEARLKGVALTKGEWNHPDVGLVIAPDRPGRPIQPHVRFVGKALAALEAHGWHQEADDVVIGRRAWTVLSRPHPTGGTTRLLETQNDPEFLGMSMDGFTAWHDDHGKAIDFPAFAIPFFEAMHALGEPCGPRDDRQIMGIANGDLTPDIFVQFGRRGGEDEDRDDRDYVVYIPVEDDPVAAATRTVAELAAFRAGIAKRRMEIRSETPRIERAAVVAACGHVEDVDAAMEMLSVRAPMVLPVHPPIGARRMKGPKDGIKIMKSFSAREGDSPRATRANGIVTLDAPAPFEWMGNTLVIRGGFALPATVMQAVQGRPIEDVVDDARLTGSGLVIERMNPVGRSGTIRIRMKSDPLPPDEARALARALMAGGK